MSQELDNYAFLRFSRVYSLHQHDTLDSSQRTVNQCPQQLPKGIMDNDDGLGPIVSLSTKKVTNASEISFQKDFMKEHTSVFSEKYQNYIEFLGKSTGIGKETINLSSIDTRTDLAPPTVSSLLRSSCSPLSLQEKQQFLKDLKHEEKLSQFLHFVIRNCLPEDSLRLVLIARSIWMEFVPFQHNDYTIREIVQMSSEIATKLEALQWQSIAEVQDTGKEQALREESSGFLEAYCCTVLLTIAEYFENPFYSQKDHRVSRGQDVLKRPYSLSLKLPVVDNDDVFKSPLPFKKRK